MGYVAEVLLAAGIGLALTILAAVALTRSRRRATRIAWSLAVMLLALVTLTSPFTLAAAQSAISRAAVPHRPAPVSSSLRLYLNNPVGQGASITALRATDGARQWQRQIVGPAQMSFTLSGDALYVPSLLAPAPVTFPIPTAITALRASDGTLLWATTIGGTADPGQGSTTSKFASLVGPPLVADGNVYLAFDYGQFVRDAGLIVALRASDGQELWRRQVINADHDTPESHPLAVGGGLVFVGGTGALRATDGTPVWAGIGGDGTPVYDSGTLYVIPAHGQIVALRATDGKRVWSVDQSHSSLVVQTIAAHDGALYLGLQTAVDGNQAYLDALDGASGKQRWQVPLPGWPQDTTVADGVIYVGMAASYAGKLGGLVVLDAATGATRWQKSTGTYIGYRHPQVVGDVLYALSTNDRPGIGPCLANCGEPDFVNALDARSGAFYWRQPLDWAGSPLEVG